MRLGMCLLIVLAVPAAAAELPGFSTGDPELHSMSALAFGPGGVLFVGDGKGGAVVALDLSDTTARQIEEPQEVVDVEGKLAALLGATPADVMVHDMAVNPLSKNVYLAVSRGRAAWSDRFLLPNDVADASVLVRVDAQGRFSAVELRAARFARVALPNPVDPGRAHGWKQGIRFCSQRTRCASTLFSQPMEVHGADRHARILDAQGEEIPLPFVEIEHGLWDPRHERLTLLFHPGRIKRGVGPGESLGAPLREGGEYRLVVDGAICDARGRALGQDFERRFRVGAADRQSPRLEGLRVSVPQRPRDPLLVELPEPLDEALLKRLVWVEDGAGQAVAGVVEVDGYEMRWRFQPTRRWTPGSYALRVHPAREDRAGNRFDRAFDRAAPSATLPESLEALRLPFVLDLPGQGRGRLRR